MADETRSRTRGWRAGRLGLAVAALCTALLAATAPNAGATPPADVVPVAVVDPLVLPGDGDAIAEGLERTLARLDDEDTVRTVVMVGAGDADTAIAAIQAEVGGFTVDHTYAAVAGFAAELTKEQVVALSELPLDVTIEADTTMRADTDRARRDTGVDLVRQGYGLDGDAAGDGTRTYGPADIVIAVLDSGIDASHHDLDGGKVLYGHNVVGAAAGCPTPPSQGTAYDDHGHGTHVASIAAGDGDTGAGTLGVAPAAALVAVKVLRCDGSGALSQVNAGIDWVISNRVPLGIDVLNVSLGSSTPSDGTDSTSRLLNQAVASGIVVVQSGGNAGPSAGTVNGQAAAQFPIVVGAVADTGVAGSSSPQPGWSLAPFSSRGPTLDGRIKPDLVAPGVAIVAARAYTGTGTNTGTGHVAMSGTSMATPFVAGVAALVLQADPGRAPAGTACSSSVVTGDCRDGVIDASMHNGVRDALVATAIDMGPVGPDPDFGAGRLDALAAVNQSLAQPTIPDTLEMPRGSVAGTIASTDNPTTVQLSVTSTAVPLAVTFVQASGSSPTTDVEVRLLDPAGQLVDSDARTTRQETLGIWPATTGTYVLEVRGVAGQGAWWADISGATTPASPGTGSPAVIGAPRASAPEPPVDTRGRYVPMVPVRALDTRDNNNPLGAGTTRTITLAGPNATGNIAGAIPANATAVAVNLTGTDPTTNTYLTAWPSGAPRPNASNLNLTPGQTSPNLAIAALGPDGALHLYNDAGTTHAIIDVVGYYTDQATTTASRLVPMVPVRALDTRDNDNPLGAGTTRTITLAGPNATGNIAGAIPANATAVAVNLTGTDPTTNTYLTAWPSGAPRPNASNLNLTPGQTSPNLAIAALGPDGALHLYNDAGTTHAIIDVVGYYTDQATTTASRLVPMVPVRALDTRDNNNPLGAGTTRTITLAGPNATGNIAGAIPANATAVAVNLTGTDPTTNTYLTAWPSGAPRPNASNLNLTPGQTSPNLAIAALGPDGALHLYNDAGTTHAIIDVVGYFVR